MRIEKRTQSSTAMVFLSPLLAIALTLVTGAILFAALDRPPLASLHAFFIAPLRDWYGISELLIKAAPLILCAAGLSFCYRAKVWNIGAEGQFIIGALVGSSVALPFNDLTEGLMFGLALPLSVICGALGGALWAALAALLKTRFNCSEILTTIMLNYIALNLLLWAVHGPLKDPNGFNFPESAILNDHLLLPFIHENYRTNISVYFPLFALTALWVITTKTLLGFQIRVLGESTPAANYAGFNSRYLVWVALGVSGALAGLAGIGEIVGPVGQLTPHVSVGYGYTAIIVVFLGRMHPVGIILAGLLLALTYLGGENLQIDFNLPKSISLLFQGMLLFYLLMTDLLVTHRLVPQRTTLPTAQAREAQQA